MRSFSFHSPLLLHLNGYGDGLVKKKQKKSLDSWNQSLKIFIKIVNKLPENGSVLIISHGGIVEGSTIGTYPDFDYSNWNRSVQYCEGVKLSFENDKCISAKFLEVHNS